MDDRAAMRLLVIASDRREFAGILAHAGGSQPEPAIRGVDFARTAGLGGHELLLVANGVGIKRAAAAVEAALPVFRPDALASIGFCGALDPSLQVADIVVASEVMGGEKRYAAARVRSSRRHHWGVVRTGVRVAQSAGERRSLRASGAIAVDMEASGVAECASTRGLPFCCVKAVTDLAGETMANDFNRALRTDGHFDTIVLLQGTLRHPFARITELLRLRRRCIQAARAMGDFFADCRF